MPHCLDSITFVIPAYNAEETIIATVDSLKAQTDPVWNAIIVDDGSHDATPEIIRDSIAGDNRFSVVYFEENQGVAEARNQAVARSKDEWIAFVDADDVLSADYLACMRVFAQAHPGFDMYQCNLTISHPDRGDSVFSETEAAWSCSLSGILEDCVLAIGGTIIRKSVFERLNGFTHGCLCEDYEFFVRFIVGGFSQIMNPRPLYTYRLRPQMSRSSDAVASAYAVADFLGILARDPALDPDTRSRILAAREQRIDSIARIQTDLALEHQAQRLRKQLTQRFGKTGASMLLGMIHLVSPVFRPVRRRMIRKNETETIAERVG